MADEKTFGEIEEKKENFITKKINELKAKHEEKKAAKEVDPEKAEKRKKTLKRVGLGAAAVVGGVITGVCLFGKDEEEIEDDEDLEILESEEEEADEAPAEEQE